jgi:hypothetical protein
MAVGRWPKETMADGRWSKETMGVRINLNQIYKAYKPINLVVSEVGHRPTANGHRFFRPSAIENTARLILQ